MNGPKLLSKAAGTPSPRNRPKVTPIGQRIKNYSFIDDDQVVSLLISIEGWDWRNVADSEIDLITEGFKSLTGASICDTAILKQKTVFIHVEVALPSSVNVNSAKYGQRHVQFRSLLAAIKGAKVRKKTSKRLVIELSKQVHSPWPSLE